MSDPECPECRLSLHPKDPTCYECLGDAYREQIMRMRESHKLMLAALEYIFPKLEEQSLTTGQLYGLFYSLAEEAIKAAKSAELPIKVGGET